MIISGKHCGKRRNCSFWAISSFVTMFSKSRQRRRKEFIWGKGLMWHLLLRRSCCDHWVGYLFTHYLIQTTSYVADDSLKQCWKRRTKRIHAYNHIYFSEWPFDSLKPSWFFCSLHFRFKIGQNFHWQI